MNDKLTQQEVNQTAWAACDTFRGVVDAGQYKDYIPCHAVPEIYLRLMERSF